ncbi:MAG TPA: GrpB family protein [Alphaproteobacteria bacterium]|nr:GrpB family protein [Alphaproteobacteria bacterium]
MAEVDEPVEVVGARAEWPTLFAAEAEAIRRALGTPAVEHIGSTAVPGLAAKPVIDIQVGVAGPPDAGVVGGPLAELGYEGLGEAGVPGRLYFRRRGAVAYNVHVVELGSGHWAANIAVRNYLRAHPSEAAEYAAQKRRAVAAGATTLLAYSDHKARFVGELVRRALAWAKDVEPGAAADGGGV